MAGVDQENHQGIPIMLYKNQNQLTGPTSDTTRLDSTHQTDAQDTIGLGIIYLDTEHPFYPTVTIDRAMAGVDQENHQGIPIMLYKNQNQLIGPTSDTTRLDSTHQTDALDTIGLDTEHTNYPTGTIVCSTATKSIFISMAIFTVHSAMNIILLTHPSVQLCCHYPDSTFPYNGTE